MTGCLSSSSLATRRTSIRLSRRGQPEVSRLGQLVFRYDRAGHRCRGGRPWTASPPTPSSASPSSATLAYAYEPPATPAIAQRSLIQRRRTGLCGTGTFDVPNVALRTGLTSSQLRSRSRSHLSPAISRLAGFASHALAHTANERSADVCHRPYCVCHEKPARAGRWGLTSCAGVVLKRRPPALTARLLAETSPGHPLVLVVRRDAKVMMGDSDPSMI